jgi:hypothetical protein
MFTRAIDLAFNVGHALQISPPDYVRSILGKPDSWRTRTCPPTELQLAAFREWNKGLPALAYILIPAVPWKPYGLNIPFSDLLFRPSLVFRYPAGVKVANPTPKQMWFFINGICSDHSVVLLNAQYLHQLFGRPLTVLHNLTRGFIPDLAACAVGKEWEQVTESAAVAFPPIYATLKNETCERLILLAHSQGTILSAVILALLEELHPPSHARWAKEAVVAPERAVARKLARRWDFERTIRAAQGETDAQSAQLASFEWPGHGRRQPEAVTPEELGKLEIYCFANCASEMIPVKIGGGNGVPAPWIESYGNEKDIVARLGVLANVTGPGSVRIGGDRYKRDAAWGHLLNAHYLCPMMKARDSGDPAGGLVPLKGNRLSIPRLFDYLAAKSPPPLRRPGSENRRRRPK